MKMDENYDPRLSAKWINLADQRLGAEVLFANDDFFAEKENLIQPGRGIFIEDKYTERGKWMDGWESRRRRTPGNDFCILKLGQVGRIFGFDVDTNHFLGNHPPFASVEGCLQPKDPLTEAHWVELLPKSALRPGSQNLFTVENKGRFSHVRLQIYPDGGVARFRVYGEIIKDWTKEAKNQPLDLASVLNGAKVVTCNDMFFSSKDNLIFPGRGKNMGDGWETKRRREPGHDWVILALGGRGEIEKIEVDTAHFKGNFPDSCSVEIADLQNGLTDHLEKAKWRELLAKQKLQADHQHYFSTELAKVGPATHVRLNIFPDGGISRLRCWGRLV